MDIPFAESLLYWRVRRLAKHRPVLPLTNFNLARVRRVLLVLTTGIGDAVFSSAVFPILRDALPEARIALFCRQAWVELFESHPCLDQVIPYPGKFRSFFSTRAALQNFGPDLVLVLHGNDPDILPLCYLAGARYIVRVPVAGTRYGFLLSNQGRPQDQFTVPDLHYVDNRLRILDTLGLPGIGQAPVLRVAADRISRVHQELSPFLLGRPYWVLHPRAADAYKSLPDELLVEILRQGLAQFPEHCVVVTGGRAERGDLEKLLADFDPLHLLVAAGHWSLADTAACLAGASAVVAPDTGILHLAAALDRPVLGLYAPTRVALVGPRSVSAPVAALEKAQTCDPCLHKNCPHRPVTCMAQFSPRDVLDALSPLLGSQS